VNHLWIHEILLDIGLIGVVLNRMDGELLLANTLKKEIIVKPKGEN